MGRIGCLNNFCRRKKKALTQAVVTSEVIGSPAVATDWASNVAVSTISVTSPSQNKARDNGDWPGWRGANRDARVAWLPDVLPATADFAWTAELAGEGLGGIAAAKGFVVAGSRDALDRNDVFQCFDIQTGDLIWQHSYPAIGKLDYGNSPRATPLIHDDYVYTLGAFGHLCCLEIESGIMMWQKNLAMEFGAPELIWGHSGSPLITGDSLILQPGGKDASIVALDFESGDVIWKTSGIEPGYSSLLLKTVGDSRQLIGYDAKSLGGWDVKTGQRLWTVVPPETGDFNVPTPVSLGDRLMVSSENNGTRIYHFNSDGTLHPDPDLTNEDLKPDSHTPVVSNSRVFGISGELLGLAPEQSLKAVTTLSDDAFTNYGSLIASDTRLLALSDEGELLLISTAEVEPTIMGRLQLQNDRTQVLSHPAIAGNSIFVRIGKTLNRMKLGE